MWRYSTGCGSERHELLQEWRDKHREGHPEAMSAGERLSPSETWCVDGPTQPDTKPEEENGERNARGEEEQTQFSETNGHADGQPDDLEEPEPSGWFGRRAKTLSWVAFSHFICLEGYILKSLSNTRAEKDKRESFVSRTT